ncbi:hypothetical protein LA080_014051 [Diaporthe eres]|nr:hypothetical protein LA080_014051 [Diaporthe eres]
MADPLSMAASIAGLISLAQGAFSAAVAINSYIHDVRHEHEERDEFCEKFKRIIANLEGLYKRLQYVETQFDPGTASRSKESTFPGMETHGGDRLLAIAQSICDPGGDYEKLEKKLTHLKSGLERLAQSKYERLERRLKWTMKKKKLAKEQEEIIQLINCMRQRVSDGDSQVNYDTHFQVRHLSQEKHVDRTFEILDWICPPSLSLRDPPNPAPAWTVNPGSNRYIERNGIYRQWERDACWQLNCVLAEAVTAKLRQVNDPLGTPVLSIFFRSRQGARQTLGNVFCSLLRQILNSRRSNGIIEIPREIRSLWIESRSTGRRGLSEDQAKELLRDQLAVFPTKFLIIDAIDEAEGCEDSIDYEIKQLRRQGVCILSTNRWEPRVSYDAAYCQECGTGPLDLAWLCRKCVGHFGEKIWLCGECHNVKGIRCSDPSHVMMHPMRVNVEIQASREDIALYVTGFLNDNFSGGDTGDDDDMFSGNVPLLAALKQRLGPDFWDSLPEKVGEAADGNFLFARLFLERLRLQRNLAGAVSLTQKLACGEVDDIEGQYDDMIRLCLEKNDKYGAQVVRDHLAIVATAHEVLTFEQLSHATAISPEDKVLDDFVGRLCSKEIVRRDTHGLLTIKAVGATDSFPVSFFHRSLTTYMEEHQSKWLPEATQMMLDSCLSYLSLDVFSRPFQSRDELEKTIQKHPFASYAACYWGFHAKSAQPTVQNNLRVLKFLHDQDRLACAMQIVSRGRPFEYASWDVAGGITALHFCAFYGLETQCQAILTFDPVSVSTGDFLYRQTPLTYASRNGHVETARLLLDAGADPNHLSKKGRSPLIEAIESFDIDMLDLMLSQADINVNVRAPGRESTTVLVKAAALGNDSAVEKLLARADINVNKPDGWGCTAISRAVQNVEMGCVSLLLRHDATDLTVTDIQGGRSALDWTAEVSVNSLFTEDEVDGVASELLADRRGLKPSNAAIALAIRLGRTSLLETFVKGNSLDCSYKDEHGRNFLHLAASTGNDLVVQLIFQQLSRSQSFDIDSLDNYKASALHLACRYLSTEAHVAAVVFLLNSGADFNLEDDDGLTAVAIARSASPGLWTMHVRPVFTARKITILATLEDSRPTLLSNLQTGNLSVVEAVLSGTSGPLHPETDMYTGYTLLYRAIELQPHDTSLLALLLPRSGHFLSAKCNLGRTCAHLAVLKGSQEALRLLTEAGIDLDARDSWGETALQLAQSYFRDEMCVHLISKGAQLPAAHEIRPTLLHAAVACGDVRAAGRLMAAGVDTGHRDAESGMTALQLAEELLRQARQDVIDGLIGRWDPADMVSEGVFEARIAESPEVVRRRKVRDFFRDAQKTDAGLRALGDHPWPREDFEKALVALQRMDPKRVLTPADWLKNPVHGGQSIQHEMVPVLPKKRLLPASHKAEAETVLHESGNSRLESASAAVSVLNLKDTVTAHAAWNMRIVGLLLAVIVGWLLGR